VISARPPTAEDGNAVVEFALVGMIVLLLTLSVAQVAVYLWQRNVLMGSLSEGARVGAAQGRTPAEGQQRAATLIREAGGRGVAGLQITSSEQGDLVVVQAQGELRPVLLPLFPTVPVQMTASMHKEESLIGRVPR
jgi:Flp pilus assembly protein TadG